MGRTATFDSTELIASARDLFWQKGFSDVSVADVESASGVGRSSIYHAFGSMRGLFDAAVDDYLTTIVTPLLTELNRDDVHPDAVCSYLADLRDAITAASAADAATPSGCLILTASATPIGADDAVHSVIENYRAMLSDAVRRGIAAHMPDASSSIVDHHTRLTVAAIIAAQCLARINPDEAARTVDAATSALGTSA